MSFSKALADSYSLTESAAMSLSTAISDTATMSESAVVVLIPPETSTLNGSVINGFTLNSQELKMINDGLKMKGRLSIAINNEVVQEVDNLVVTAGKGYVASRMKDTTATAMSHMAIGTGSTAAAAGDTALGTESARTALTSTTVTNNEVVYVDTFGAGMVLVRLLKLAYLTLLQVALCCAGQCFQ